MCSVLDYDHAIEEIAFLDKAYEQAKSKLEKYIQATVSTVGIDNLNQFQLKILESLETEALDALSDVSDYRVRLSRLRSSEC